MKKINSILMMLLVAITSMVFTSCEKEQDELIIGTWTLASYEAKCYIDGVYDEGNSEKTRYQETWTFNKGEQLIVEGNGYTNTYTYSVQDNELHTNLIQGEAFSDTKTYFIIETLNSNTMVLSLEEWYDGGVMYEFIVKLTK